MKFLKVALPPQNEIDELESEITFDARRHAYCQVRSPVEFATEPLAGAITQTVTAKD